MKKLCVIDDDDVYHFIIRKVAEQSGLISEFTAFTNSIKALEHLEECVDSPSCFPNVILLDINMPEMDGWQFLEKFVPIRARAPHPVDIYLVSSSVDVRDIEKARKHPELRDYIIKPLTRENLEHIIDQIGR